jgi:hypothetical protein
MFRPHIVGPLRLEVGALPLFTGGGVWNASAGLYVEMLRQPSWEPYVAAGAAAGQKCGEDVEQARLVCSTIYFASARFGAAWASAKTVRTALPSMLEHGTGRRIQPTKSPGRSSFRWAASASIGSFDRHNTRGRPPTRALQLTSAPRAVGS